MLKNRSGLGYSQLGKQASVSSSSLHRYCSGASVPPDYRIVLSFARSCGATPEETRNLHRLWAVADAHRSAANGSGADRSATAAGTDSAAPAAVASPATPAVASPEPPDVAPAEPAAASPPAGRRSRYLAFATTAGLMLLAVTVGWFAADVARGASRPGPDDSRLLFSQACREPVSMGQHDECVREVQSLLKRAGGNLTVDSAFGPETLRRVTAFQVLAGLPPKGVVDDATKRALYDRRVRLPTWPPSRVESRIRQVFSEDPDRAVAIARCQSRLDPLFITSNTNGTRNWGLFQISDMRLQEFDGTPADAFDPEWNIRAAHRLWSVARDFRDWPYCSGALTAAPSPPGQTPAGAGVSSGGGA